jgi:hypothetical protein
MTESIACGLQSGAKHREPLLPNSLRGQPLARAAARRLIEFRFPFPGCIG